MNATISAYTHMLPPWPYGGATCTLRIWPNKVFRTSEDELVVKGGPGSKQFHYDIPCTIASGVVSIPEINIDSTTDGQPNTSTYTAAFLDSNGKLKFFFLKKFKVPTTPDPVTWPYLFAYKNNAFGDTTPPSAPVLSGISGGQLSIDWSWTASTDT